MAISWIQPSFAGGEIGPSLYGRIDMAKYQVALRKCDNFIVRQYGGVENRPGTRFVGAAKYPNRKCRLIPFQFSTVQTYALEFGHQYMRVIKDGALVLNSSNVIYEIATPYTEADLFRIKFTQSADVLTLVHPAYPPKELRRYAHDNWQLVDVVTKNGPFEDINIDESVTVYASASTGTITLTASASIFGSEQVGKLFYLEQPAVDSVPVWETSKSTSIDDVRRADSNYYRAVTAGKTGTLRPSHTEGTSWDGWGGSGDDDTGIEWEYLHSGFGIARITAANGTTATAEVISYIPSQIVGEDNASYKWAKYAWNSINGYPGTVVYYQQRLYFAASTAFPQTIWASRTGDYKDFGKSNPTQDDDRIIYTYAGRQVNEIRHLIDVGSLVALTSGGEYVITGDQNKVLTPSSFAFSSQGSNGSSNVPPIAVANIALFVQEKGSVVRDLAYSFDVDGYQGNDLTILANHLFQKHSIVDWCFSIVPYSSAFCIRDDGKLLVMTYLRDQQVFAWAPQSSTGKYESTCSISEGNEDAVYFVVNRTVNGQTVRYIERLSSRLFTSDEDAFFVDSGLSYDGRNTSDRTMTITGGSGEWDYVLVVRWRKVWRLSLRGRVKVQCDAPQQQQYVQRQILPMPQVQILRSVWHSVGLLQKRFVMVAIAKWLTSMMCWIDRQLLLMLFLGWRLVVSADLLTLAVRLQAPPIFHQLMSMLHWRRMPLIMLKLIFLPACRSTCFRAILTFRLCEKLCLMLARGDL